MGNPTDILYPADGVRYEGHNSYQLEEVIKGSNFHLMGHFHMRGDYNDYILTSGIVKL